MGLRLSQLLNPAWVALFAKWPQSWLPRATLLKVPVAPNGNVHSDLLGGIHLFECESDFHLSLSCELMRTGLSRSWGVNFHSADLVLQCSVWGGLTLRSGLGRQQRQTPGRWGLSPAWAPGETRRTCRPWCSEVSTASVLGIPQCFHLHLLSCHLFI